LPFSAAIIKTSINSPAALEQLKKKIEPFVLVQTHEI
jgi:hypothetical protein